MKTLPDLPSGSKEPYQTPDLEIIEMCIEHALAINPSSPPASIPGFGGDEW